MDQGFGGRVFLSEEEWKTYLRCPPVRSGVPDVHQLQVRRGSPGRCDFCKDEGREKGPLQVAHRIRFFAAIRDLGLTPEFINREAWLGLAHRKGCNTKFEWEIQRVVDEVRRYISDPGRREEVPGYLPERVRRALTK